MARTFTLGLFAIAMSMSPALAQQADTHPDHHGAGHMAGHAANDMHGHRYAKGHGQEHCPMMSGQGDARSDAMMHHCAPAKAPDHKDEKAAPARN